MIIILHIDFAVFMIEYSISNLVAKLLLIKFPNDKNCGLTSINPII